MFKMFKSDTKINIKKYIPFFIYFVLIAIASIVFDQVSKVIAMNNLTQGVAVPFIPNFIDFLLTYNKGAAWGMGDGEIWSRILLCAISWAVAIFLPCYIAYLIIKNREISPLYGVCLALIWGGDIGNLIDRTFFFDRGVVDFISIQSWFPGFGIFNIADSCLVVGILLLLVYFLIVEFKNQKAERDRNIAYLKEKESKENSLENKNENVSENENEPETPQNNQ